jgi:cytochrome c oxidase assembly protein subunit 15
LTDREWHRLYALYQQIPQYDLVNSGFGLAGFKQIFWLEWTHRLWGRLIGAAFLIPLVWFAVTGRLERRLLPRLVGFFVLGGLQGAVGWFMVASGFSPDATAVEPVRLVTHLTLAVLLYGAVLWTALTLFPPGPRISESGHVLKFLSWATTGLVALTIAAGGFVAGLHAGLVYNTFPWMDGQLVPEGYAELRPFVRNLIANIPAVQFDHRVLATLTLLSASGLVIAALPYRDRLGWRMGFVAAAVVAQYALGVATLLWVVPAGLAVLHQIGATILFTSVLLVVHALRYARGKSPTGSVRVFPRAGHGQSSHRHPHHGQTTRGTPFYGSITSTVAEDPKP